MSEDKRVLLIVPAFNEEESLLSTVNDIRKYCHDKIIDYDLIVVNDGSTDRTFEICKINKIPVINLIHNLGIGGAVQTGYKYALENDYDIAVQFDGDGQHDIESIDSLIKPLIKDDCDMIIGSRFINNDFDNFKSSLARRVGIRIISSAMKFTTGRKIYDTTSGFRAVNKNVINTFANSYPTEYPEPITTTELLRKGFRVKEVPAKMYEREGGTSSIKAWKTAYYMFNVIITILIIKIRRYSND